MSSVCLIPRGNSENWSHTHAQKRETFSENNSFIHSSSYRPIELAPHAQYCSDTSSASLPDNSSNNSTIAVGTDATTDGTDNRKLVPDAQEPRDVDDIQLDLQVANP